ncbi:MAG TPA: siderophore-interacting protein [Actinophytocola sp.]|uniref:siderophore-interacting protein n=1 Tax=Actinophytocola sp. TaxID=1872138 RepID=UPI002DDD43AE|nr:siderophore-interacting protein [Actinophytocola sp.]HEV2779777.1 siderophore-interacting protein [Actinophytocola sp.]
MTTSSTTAAPHASRRPPVRLWRVPVRRVERVTPRMARVTVAGDELADFPAAGTDQNVMLYFYPDGVTLPEPLTLESARAMWSRVRPLTRTYTIRRYDGAACEIDFDFVLHGEHGLASAWAQRVRPGDQVIFVGPSPAYRPAPDVDTYLLAGDETALPAIAAILRELPAGARALVYVEVADAAEQQPLPTAAAAEITWLHRDGRPDLLERAVRSAVLPEDRTEAWVAGERSAVLAVRRHLLDERRLERHRVRPTTYWRRGQSGN